MLVVDFARGKNCGQGTDQITFKRSFATVSQWHFGKLPTGSNILFTEIRYSIRLPQMPRVFDVLRESCAYCKLTEGNACNTCQMQTFCLFNCCRSSMRSSRQSRFLSISSSWIAVPINLIHSVEIPTFFSDVMSEGLTLAWIKASESVSSFVPHSWTHLSLVTYYSVTSEELSLWVVRTQACVDM